MQGGYGKEEAPEDQGSRIPLLWATLIETGLSEQQQASGQVI